MKPKLLIIRGLPGAGKSMLAKQSNFLHVEADMFRYQPDGSYVYAPSTNHPIHRKCEDLVFDVLRSGYSVAVSNTFIFMKHLEQYIKIGRFHNATIEIVEAKGNYGSVHGMPDIEWERMREKWQPLKDEWRKYES